MNKSRRQFITAATVLGGSTAFSAIPLVPKQKREPLAHHVFFWLKNPNSKQDLNKLIEGVRTLAKIETVKELHVGVVAGTEKRDVVDASWHVSELIFFHDLAGQSTYQSHPIHQNFIKNYGSLRQKVVVYDAMEV